MAETTHINRFRQKKLRNHKDREKAEQLNTYMYPKNNLYTRQEFELLDTIYSDSDESAVITKVEDSLDVNKFWLDEKIGIPKDKNNLFSKLSWFFSGILIASVIWFICLQVTIFQIKSKSNTQLVFHKTLDIVTDKTADKQISANLLSHKQTKTFGLGFQEWLKNMSSNSTVNNKSDDKAIKEEAKENTQVVPEDVPKIKYHTISNGDSLWIIANKYYSDPSPANIEKIMKANKMRRIGILQPGQKLIIP